MAKNVLKNHAAKNQTVINNRIVNNASTSHQKIIEEVFNSMECPICMEFLQAPIFMCGTGHNICLKCRKILTTPVCPLCKAHISDQRNYSLETISSKLCLPCPNSKFGCTDVNPPDRVDSHAKVCKFKSFRCPIGKEYGKCTHMSINIFNMEEHFKKLHPGNMLLKIGDEVIYPNFDSYTDYRDTQLVVFENCLFLYHVNIDASKSIVYWTLQWVANKSHNRMWKYEFAFADEKHNSKILFSSKCPTMHKKSTEIFDSGKCVAIPISVLKNFVREKNLHFKFFIKPFNISCSEKKATSVKNGKQKNKPVIIVEALSGV